MKQYKRPSKAQITALALGALAVSSFGTTDVYADSTRSLEWQNQSEYTRPIADNFTVSRSEGSSKEK